MSIRLEGVCYEYEPGTAMAKQVLRDIDLEIPMGQFVGLIGHTGSGKSTLAQHFNGLLAPSRGRVLFAGEDIHQKGFDRRALRSQVGLVFQYPEHQLFESEVFLDVCFGPKNMGLNQEEVAERAYWALEQVGLPKDCYQLSPFELSGGQKRRVAIAGVLAMKPRILLLDEPTAGLDPKGREEILGMIKALQKNLGMSILLISHSMEDIAGYVDRILVMHQGRMVMDGSPKEVFSQAERLESMGLAAPAVYYALQALKKKGWDLPARGTTLEEAAEEIAIAYRRRRVHGR